MRSPDHLERDMSAISVLVVSTEHSVQSAIEASFSLPPKLEFVENSQAALQVLRQRSVDVLVGDIDALDLDGWRLARLVRSGILKCQADVPIMMISRTWSQRIAEVTAREYGINALVSPENLANFSTLVSNILSDGQGVFRPPRLLVVEDQQDTSDLICRVLSGSFEIDVAADGEEGLNLWLAKRHDLVLLDIMLPKMCGREVLIEILAQRPAQPVVIMTAHAAIDQAEELMLIGAVDFLPKPFRPAQLRNVCNIAVHREDYFISNAEFSAQVSALKDSESAFRDLYHSHHKLLDELQSVVMKLDENLNIRFLNRTWETLMGYRISDSLGKSIEHFVSQGNEDALLAFKGKLRHALRNDSVKHDIELCLLDNKDRKIWTQLKVTSSSAVYGEPTLTICVDNITERKRTQKQLEHLAMHDSLTGLYNRYYFESSLGHLAADAKKNGRQHGLVYIDLDYFKIVNDTFGHQRGDEVLREISSLLSSRVGPSDFLCRLGGDEFAVLVHSVSEEEVKQCAQDIQNIIGECSFQLQEQRISLGCSIGLALIDGSVDNAEQYLMQADIALYVAKGRGRNLIHLYNPEDSESDEMRRSINWSQKIRDALAENRMLLYFQPVYDVDNETIAYYETLVRYCAKNGEVIGPANFIPALENTGEVKILDRRVIELATDALKRYPQLHHIAVNLSAQAFKDESLLPTITECLKSANVNASRLTFELTESASLFNLGITQRVITGLHDLGCHFSVDDFGTGFSSFSYLKQLPADYIKLDGSFIRNLHNDPVDQALVKSIIQVIQALGKKAVAEFVENKEILDILKTMGVNLVQGYHIGYPKPIEKIFPGLEKTQEVP